MLESWSMKKFLVVIVLSLIWCNISFAKDFIIVCEGSIKSTSGLSSDSDNLFEEWKLVAGKYSIVYADLLNTNKWNYRGGYISTDINLSNNIITITEYNVPAKRGYTIKKYQHTISLNSGRFSWYQHLESQSFTWISNAQGRCNGYKELLSYLN